METIMRDDQISTMTGDRCGCNESRAIQRLPGSDCQGIRQHFGRVRFAAMTTGGL